MPIFLYILIYFYIKCIKEYDTLTVTYPGGISVGKSMIIYVGESPDPPTATISATPDKVFAGESSVLTWSSANAETCVIKPDVGSVASEGSVTVSPQATTTYTLTTSNPGGTATADVSAEVIPRISITYPSEGDTIYRPDVMVRGTLAKTWEKEIGIVANGILATVYEDEFVANHVPLEEGENIITAVAVNTAGKKSEISVTANMVMPEKYIRLVSDHASGVSPFGTTLEIGGNMDVSDSELSYAGNGTVEISETEAGKYDVGITGSGLFRLTATARDSDGNSDSDTIAVLIHAPDDFDAMLRGKWEGMKNRLSAGDIEGATEYFFLPSREKYTQIFTAIGDGLPEFVAGTEDIEQVYTREALAKYRIRRNEEIDGEIVRITYYIYFAKGPEGLWYIDEF